MWNLTLTYNGIPYHFTDPQAEVEEPRLREMLDTVQKEFNIVERSFPERILDLYWDDDCKDELPIKHYPRSENSVLPVEVLAVLQNKKGRN